jgi:hypothetical protein
MIDTPDVRNVSRWMLFSLLLFITSSSTIHTEKVLTSGTESAWELMENSEGVKIYFRWIDLPDKVRVRERKAEIIVHNTLEKSLKAITGEKEIPVWMSGIKKLFILHHDRPEKWYTYSLYGLPWPFNDRELITLNTLSTNPKKDRILLDMRSSDESYPPAKGVERLTHYKASWELSEIKAGLVKMTFIGRSEDPPAFPRCIQDPVIKKVFFRNMVSLNELLNGKSKSK